MPSSHKLLADAWRGRTASSSVASCSAHLKVPRDEVEPSRRSPTEPKPPSPLRGATTLPPVSLDATTVPEPSTAVKVGEPPMNSCTHGSGG